MMVFDIRLKVWGIAWRVGVGWDMRTMVFKTWRTMVFETWRKRTHGMEGGIF